MIWFRTLLINFISLISYQAQCTKNSFEKLKRAIGQYLVALPIDDDKTKEWRHFLRMVCARSVSVQGFGSLDINMALLPKIVMFFTTYTVVALQFNNVV